MQNLLNNASFLIPSFIQTKFKNFSPATVRKTIVFAAIIISFEICTCFRPTFYIWIVHKYSKRALNVVLWPRLIHDETSHNKVTFEVLELLPLINRCLGMRAKNQTIPKDLPKEHVFMRALAGSGSYKS